MFKTLFAPSRGEPIVEPSDLATRRMAEFMELAASIVNDTRTEVIEIGDWDMDSDANISVAHGLTLANIRSTDVLIRNDANTDYYPLDIDSNFTGSDGRWHVNETNAILVRLGGGFFDGAAFDSTSYNRGWVTITYVI